MAAVATARRPIRGFMSYAHADLPLVERFRSLLAPRLAIDRTWAYEVWWDADILVGRRWEDEIRRALAACDFGLLLVTPAFLSREYIRTVELPALVEGTDKVVVPVGLQYVDFARSDLRGLEQHQIFRFQGPTHREPQWFASLRAENPARFCDELARQLTERLEEDSSS